MKLAMAIGNDVKGIAFALYVLVALIWFIPDRRIERVFAD